MHYLWTGAPSLPRAPCRVSYLPPRPLRCHKIANGQAQAHVAMWMTSTAPGLWLTSGYLRRPARPALELPSDPVARVWHQCSRAAIAPSTPRAGREAATDRTETTLRGCVSRTHASGQKTLRVGRSSCADSGLPSVSAGSPHRRTISLQLPPQRCSAMLRSITLQSADPAFPPGPWSVRPVNKRELLMPAEHRLYLSREASIGLAHCVSGESPTERCPSSSPQSNLHGGLRRADRAERER